MRTIDKRDKPCPPVPGENDTRPYPETTSQLYTIKVITPLFGGGVEAGINDPVTLIRPSSIRGHLRFWWRATRGASCSSVAELRQREGEIWGTAENPSPVTIEIIQPSIFPDKIEPARSDSYVLFPAIQNGNLLSKEDFHFTLKLRWFNKSRLDKLRYLENQKLYEANQELLPEKIEDIALDIESAVWAWTNFGGIGARTRRGCGALYCKELAPLSIEKISDWFTSSFARFGLSKIATSFDWPMLSNGLLISDETEEPMKAWHTIIELLRQFRQGKIGRRLRPYGRSYWPEADSLRAITGRGKHTHLTSITLPSPVNPAFPRAEFGLPIVFHFKDGADEPNNCTLYGYENNKNDGEKKGKRLDHMASPIILRPLAIGDGSQAVSMLVRLTTLLPSALELDGINHPPMLSTVNIRRADLKTYPKSPLGPPFPGQPPRSTLGSALEAFLAFAREKGFKEPQP